jgi:hypothetical protein
MLTFLRSPKISQGQKYNPNRPTHEMATTENTTFSRRVRRMLGLSLHNWENVMLLFLGVAAIAAALVGIWTYAVVQLQKQEAADAKKDFDEYKLTVDGQVADAKKEGIQAGEKAGSAILRAAELEKEAANARLETEKIKGVVSWRTISPASASALERVLAAKPGAVNLRFMDGDPEALFFAIQFSQILAKAHWQIAPGALKPANAIVFGISLPDATGTDIQTLREAFSAANIRFSPNPVPGGPSFSVSTIQGAPMLMIGSRPPPQLP